MDTFGLPPYVPNFNVVADFECAQKYEKIDIHFSKTHILGVFGTYDYAKFVM